MATALSARPPGPWGGHMHWGPSPYGYGGPPPPPHPAFYHHPAFAAHAAHAAQMSAYGGAPPGYPPMHPAWHNLPPPPLLPPQPGALSGVPHPHPYSHVAAAAAAAQQQAAAAAASRQVQAGYAAAIEAFQQVSRAQHAAVQAEEKHAASEAEAEAKAEAEAAAQEEAAAKEAAAKQETLEKDEAAAKAKAEMKEEKTASPASGAAAGSKHERDEEAAEAKEEAAPASSSAATPPPPKKRQRVDATPPSSPEPDNDGDANQAAASASNTSSPRIHQPTSMAARPLRKQRVASTVAKHRVRQQLVDDEMDEQLEAVATGAVPVAAPDDAAEDANYVDELEDEGSADDADTDEDEAPAPVEKKEKHAAPANSTSSSIPTPTHRYASWQQQQQQQQQHLASFASSSKLWPGASHVGPTQAQHHFSPAAFAGGQLLPPHPVPGSALASYQQHMNAYALQTDNPTPGAPIPATVRNARRIGADRRRRLKLKEALDSLRDIILRHGQDASAYDQVSVLYSSIDLMHSFERMIEHQIAMLQTHEKTFITLNKRLQLYESADHQFAQQQAAAVHMGMPFPPVPAVAPAIAMATATAPPASAPGPAPAPKVKKIKQRKCDPMASLVQVASADGVDDGSIERSAAESLACVGTAR